MGVNGECSNRVVLERSGILVVFFFFKQKTAYEIKECDWSSDVCSSDLTRFAGNAAENFTVVIFSPTLGFTNTTTLNVFPGANVPEAGAKLNVAALDAIGKTKAIVKIEYKIFFIMIIYYCLIGAKPTNW